jgi:hypothetical protein
MLGSVQRTVGNVTDTTSCVITSSDHAPTPSLKEVSMGVPSALPRSLDNSGANRQRKIAKMLGIVFECLVHLIVIAGIVG